jgi:5-methylcytosine-specific restriction protein A
MTVLRACVICGKPSRESYCREHKPAPFRGSTRRKRLPRDWPERRAQVLWRDPVCRICHQAKATEVDHVIHGDDHGLANLQGICVPCHRSKTGREGRAAQG